MAMQLLAIDLGKRSFHLHGIDADGIVVSRKVSRGKLMEMVVGFDAQIIAMEACASAHHWARAIGSLGHEVRLIAPLYVKPFVKRQKNDASEMPRQLQRRRPARRCGSWRRRPRPSRRQQWRSGHETCSSGSGPKRSTRSADPERERDDDVRATRRNFRQRGATSPHGSG